MTNVGVTALAVGDTFKLFTPALANGNALTIAGPAGVTFANNLAVDGSITVTSAGDTANYPTNITATVSGSTLNLSWPATHLGWTLQSQTNSLSTGLGTNWTDVAGSSSGTNASITIDPANPTVFFRLRQ